MNSYNYLSSIILIYCLESLDKRIEIVERYNSKSLNLLKNIFKLSNQLNLISVDKFNDDFNLILEEYFSENQLGAEVDENFAKEVLKDQQKDVIEVNIFAKILLHSSYSLNNSGKIDFMNYLMLIKKLNDLKNNIDKLQFYFKQDFNFLNEFKMFLKGFKSGYRRLQLDFIELLNRFITAELELITDKIVATQFYQSIIEVC
ncbi:hypothetical protein QK694_s6gp1 [Emaravirus camelliae]|uniref:Uncharacterized protein n=1 Tax=Emaravirus camelliae TaxID=2843907 RepID=A0A6B9QUA1_9VIRU|nr:hypothetical protein QK694_s6gp1 [Emaravirus camelliae]QHG11078.1 hypothetical protein [Emaravirus camelliae]